MHLPKCCLKHHEIWENLDSRTGTKKQKTKQNSSFQEERLARFLSLTDEMGDERSKRKGRNNCKKPKWKRNSIILTSCLSLSFQVRTLWNMTDLVAGHLQSSWNNQHPKHERQTWRYLVWKSNSSVEILFHIPCRSCLVFPKGASINHDSYTKSQFPQHLL